MLDHMYVLNLVINGLPSIQKEENDKIIEIVTLCFKPCYKWITFNTDSVKLLHEIKRGVLNLVINGLPSILY